jgi:ribulose-5-phosphate 4-epimerase/fuculose-1-phosphate aldolase
MVWTRGLRFPFRKEAAMNAKLDTAIREVVIANRILANEKIVDASGHVSARHPLDPGRFLISWSRSPEHVRPEDIMECALDGTPLNGDKRPPYQERFIHAAIYEARPDVSAVVHAHPEEVLPFTVTDEPLRALISSASMIGTSVPVWDIADNFGDDTSLLVENIAEGRDLARAIGQGNLMLMAAHGIAAACPTMIEVIRLAVYATRNARVQLAAMQIGKKIRFLSEGEVNNRKAGRYFSAESHGIYRAWEHWALRAGCADLLPERDEATLRTS